MAGRPRNDANTEQVAEPKKLMRSPHKREKTVNPRDKNQVGILDLDTEGNGVDYYDKCLVEVNRINNGEGGITRGVTIRSIEQQKMPSHQDMIDSLNYSQDWQNPADGGKPLILFYFLHGSVAVGDMYAANDVYRKLPDPENEEGDEEFTNSPKDAIRMHGILKPVKLNITEKQIERWLPSKTSPYGKPVFK